MGGLQGDRRVAGMRRAPLAGGQPADRAVGIDLVIVERLHLAHRGTGLVVGEGHALDLAAHRFPRVPEQRLHAGEVRRRADVHRVGDGGGAGTRAVVAGLQVGRHHVVEIGGGQELLHRQAELHREQAGGQVAEVARRDDEHRFDAFRQLPGTMEVVETLRDEPREIDRVRRGEIEAFRQFAVEEGGLHQPLAVVEGAVDLQRGNVVAEGGELLFLEPGDLALRIEDDHPRPRHPVEGGGDRAAGVAGSGDQHGQLAVLAAGQPGHQPGHEARAEILEGERRPVEELEDVIARREGDQGRLERHRALDDFLQRRGWHVLVEERVRHRVADFLEGQFPPDRPEFRAQHRQRVGHVKPVVRRQRAEDRFLQADAVGGVVGGVVEHGSDNGVEVPS